jgi:hypothetical protein
MFDVSARPYAPARTLTFAVPMRRFEQMVRNMDERLLMIAAPASGRRLALSGATAARAAGEQPSERLFKAVPGTAGDPGIIAYVRRSTGDIHVISPDGAGDRVL